MANAYNNKVVLSNGTTIIDLSTDTVTDASHIMSGKVGHLADGSVVTGTGASESQVVSIEDVPNTTGTTAVITGVAAPEGSISITTNGTHDVTAYEEAIVNVPSQTPTIQPLSVTSNGTYTAPSGVDGYSPVTVNVSGGGGGSADPNADVIFIDYDGTVLHSYSASEFANLTEMPANPTHSGLVAQGWNWSLDVAKRQIAAEPAAGLVIGQMYTTDDGKTRIYVYLPSNCTAPHLGLAPNGTVAIDWGDNSETTQLTGTSVSTLVTAQHEYASPGSYVITIEPISGTFAILSYSTAANNSTSLLMKGAINQSYVDQPYANAIMRVEIGANCRLGKRAFWMCRGLRSVTIPSSVISFGEYAFNNCASLISVTIPTAVASIQSFSFSGCGALTYIANSASASASPPQGSFQSCYSLKRTSWKYDGQGSFQSSSFSTCYSLVRANVSGGATKIYSSAFAGCYSLSTAITIPTTVTEIASSAFSNCYSMREYHFLSTTPPTLANTNAFNNIQPDCKIYVPKGSLSAYQTASNWSTYASHMVEEE